MATATATTMTTEIEHPDAPHIRRQVEFYFSDENLPTDLHMLQCCGGRENLPVSISRICGFRKMRQYKPKSIVPEALRKSPFLVVSEDGKKVSRKVPLQGPCALDPDYYNDDEIAYDPRASLPVVHPVPLIPQDKPKYPPGMTKNTMKPTGFEDTYIEPPITPGEAKDEESMYDPNKHFIERIEIAIQRFKRKRRMHTSYANVFNKWMRFGGVETGPRMFGGLSKKDMTDMDAEQIARSLAIHNVPWDRDNPKYWVVDFVGVAEGFLSCFFPTQFGFSPPQIKTACQVLRSFYNYLLFHSVCPEFNDEIAKALKLCDRAEFELSKLYDAGFALPGTFNSAASTIFGGSKAGTFTGDQAWAITLREEGVDLGEIGFRDEEARVIFRTAVAIMGTDEQQVMLDTQAVKVLKDESVGLEITSIAKSDDMTREMYTLQNEATAEKLHQDPLGKIVCRTWHIEDSNQYDLPKDKYPDGRPNRTKEGQEYEFWAEDRVLEECFVGMNMDARILVLEGGIAILDDVRDCMCSFYRWLPNELWMSRHPRQVVVKKRGGLFNEEERPGEGESLVDADDEQDSDD